MNSDSELTILLSGILFTLKDNNDGTYDAHNKNGLAYTSLHSTHESWNDELTILIKYIKEVERKKRLSKMKDQGNDMDTIKTYYPSKIFPQYIRQMKIAKIEKGITITSFINEAIAEKLEREGLL